MKTHVYLNRARATALMELFAQLPDCVPVQNCDAVTYEFSLASGRVLVVTQSQDGDTVFIDCDDTHGLPIAES